MTIKQATFTVDELDIYIDRIDGIEGFEGHYSVEIFSNEGIRRLKYREKFGSFQAAFGHVKKEVLKLDV